MKGSYLDYIEQEQSYFRSERYKKNKNYWNEKFKQLPESLNKSSTTEGKRKEYVLSSDLSLKIREFVKKNECSLNIFFRNISFIVY
ncbi:condensation domain-containing protein [Paenibacillus gorillae]|uniref:condensation domain-containing protein n=1 Tax=Paenibacillus gorillae TaxID=1243662 RepID=UPI00192E4D51